MKGDFSRLTFDPRKHFSRVLLQQGRVQLDADWNEQAAILLHYLQALAADLIGAHGGVADSFKVEPSFAGKTFPKDFAIRRGHYYVDGILCELEATPVPIVNFPPGNPNQLQVLHSIVDNGEFQKGQYVEIFAATPPPDPILAQITDVDQKHRALTLDAQVTGFDLQAGPKVRRITTYVSQPDYPITVGGELAPQKNYLVYLDVWERHVTYVEDDIIREVALIGPDTATRARVIWQVRSTDKTPNGQTIPSTPPAGVADWHTWVDDNWSGWIAQWQPATRGQLKAKSKEDPTEDTDPCITPPEAHYRGAENQLYRVEIHRGGEANAATFKWSRDNGSMVAAWIGKEGNDLMVNGIRDNVRG